MQRRKFITLLGGAVVAWPLAARAQQPERVRRIGVLMGLAADDPEAQARVAAFLQGLQELGWSVGRNLIVDIRWSTGNADARKYAAELVALAPNVILTNTTAAAAPLFQITRTVPIVFTNVPDPVGAGYVDSLSQPGGNITGFTPFEYSMSEMAAAAQGDRPRRNASGGFSRSFHSGRTCPVRCYPSRCVVAWCGVASG
jgi:putative ABC transport system substrate-binding protein